MSNLILNASLVGDWFKSLWINLWLLIDNVIYVFINWVYRVFILVAEVDIFGGGAQIEAITRRVYVIVGIAMLFIFAYNLILLLVNPEGKYIGNMTSVIKNAIISIILVTFLPLIFSYMTVVQKHVLESNVIGQIVLGTAGNDMNNTNKKAGVKAAVDIFSAFYHPEGQSYLSCEKDPSAHDLCVTYVKAMEDAKNNDDISSFIWNEDLKNGAKDGTMEYNWIISTAAGVFALWMFVSFALDVGVRIGKLAFYELVSPIPVMMRIMPGNKMFDKWFSGLKSTYISLFVRLAIIYFAMYAITLVPKVFEGMWADGSIDHPILVGLANVVVILGILKFAQEAPKLLSDIFSSGGEKISLGIGSKIKDNKLAMSGMGLVGGGAVGLASNVRKMFTKDNAGNTKFNWSNPLRGVGSAAATGARGGYNAKNFTDLRNSIEESSYSTREVQARYAARRARGEEALNGSAASGLNDIPIIGGIAQNLVGGTLNVRDSVVEGFENVDDFLSGGSATDIRKKAASDAEGSVSALLKAFENDNFDALKKFEADARKSFYAGKDVNIPGLSGALNQSSTSAADFDTHLKNYIKAQKKELYMSSFKDPEKREKFEAYQEKVSNSLRESFPMLGDEFSNKLVSEFSTKFGAQFDDLNKVLNNISSADPNADPNLSDKLIFVQSMLKKESELIPLRQRNSGSSGGSSS